jgi:hypothetical protein
MTFAVHFLCAIIAIPKVYIKI